MSVFEPKPFEQIAADMIERLRASTDQITDLNVGSVARSMLEAGAVELDDFYQSVYLGLLAAIPEAIYQGFGFDRLTAVAAYGQITLSTSAPAVSVITIPQGYAVETRTGVRYETTEVATIAVGQIAVTVPVRCTQVGPVGNVPAGEVTLPVTAISGITSVTNAFPITSGRDIETDAERQSRFNDYIAAISRSTKEAIRYGASQAQVKAPDGTVLEYVEEARVYEPFETNPNQPIGFVRVLISGAGGQTSPELVAETQRVVDGYVADDGTEVVGWKAAGVVAEVYPVQQVPITVSGEITADPGYEVDAISAAVQSAIHDYVATLGIGRAVVVSEIVAAAQSVAGVYDYRSLLPADNISIDDGSIATVDAITLQ